MRHLRHPKKEYFSVLFKSVKADNLSSAAIKQIYNLILDQTLKPGDM